MTTLARKIQIAILGGASAQTVHDLLAELGIEAGRTPTATCLEEVRDCILRDTAVSDAQMREAVSNVGITGIDPDAILRWISARAAEPADPDREA